jgi:mRNA interferase RelE/StbE
MFWLQCSQMEYTIPLSPEAVDDLRALKANVRAVVRDVIRDYLRHEPTKTSKSRIKRLRGLLRPQYRLRVEDVRVFYDVIGATVEILAIVPKEEADAWLEKAGE